MTGLKSGSGDDLWGDDESDEAEETSTSQDSGNDSAEEPRSEGTPEPSRSKNDGTETSSPQDTPSQQPYLIRRMYEGKSVQFERDERLTFFVHDDVVDGERELVAEVEAAFGRNVPKFDVREAVYRAALRNREDVKDELIKMGYPEDGDS